MRKISSLIIFLILTAKLYSQPRYALGCEYGFKSKQLNGAGEVFNYGKIQTIGFKLEREFLKVTKPHPIVFTSYNSNLVYLETKDLFGFDFTKINTAFKFRASNYNVGIGYLFPVFPNLIVKLMVKGTINSVNSTETVGSTSNLNKNFEANYSSPGKIKESIFFSTNKATFNQSISLGGIIRLSKYFDLEIGYEKFFKNFNNVNYNAEFTAKNIHTGMDEKINYQQNLEFPLSYFRFGLAYKFEKLRLKDVFK